LIPTGSVNHSAGEAGQILDQIHLDTLSLCNAPPRDVMHGLPTRRSGTDAAGFLWFPHRALSRPPHWMQGNDA
jgi:hypothetical protein